MEKGYKNNLSATLISRKWYKEVTSQVQHLPLFIFGCWSGMFRVGGGVLFAVRLYNNAKSASFK